MNYALNIFVADTSSLRNRSFMFAYASSPYIATVWINGPLATAFYHGPGWRWSFGVWLIVTLTVEIPLWALFYYFPSVTQPIPSLTHIYLWNVRMTTYIGSGALELIRSYFLV